MNGRNQLKDNGPLSAKWEVKAKSMESSLTAKVDAVSFYCRDVRELGRIVLGLNHRAVVLNRIGGSDQIGGVVCSQSQLHEGNTDGGEDEHHPLSIMGSYSPPSSSLAKDSSDSSTRFRSNGSFESGND